jgi:alkylhydroperoxidase family enzyme
MMSATLLSLLQSDVVPVETLRRRYGSSFFELARTMLGVIPNSGGYLDIWPVGFRTYNLLVPSLLNMPLALWGLGAPRDLVGLSMYAASRAAQCAYCSAHSCSFALRRGAPSASVTEALDGNTEPRARAAIAVARSLSSVPATITDDERVELHRHFAAAHAEWIVLAVAMMGFLNKFMDAVGVELEQSLVDEVHALIAPTGWYPGKHFAGSVTSTRPPRADSLATRLGVLRHAPAAISLERKWTAGVPSRWPAVGDFLSASVGYDFPVLSRLTHGRAVRAIAVAVRDNFDAAASVIGLPLKGRLGRVYAEAVDDAALAGAVEKLSRRHPPCSDDTRPQAALRLAHAASFSPAQIDTDVVAACRESGLGAAAIIEIVVWLAVLQMLHRLIAFYRA